ncbi:MAG: hypothetical protein ABIG20_02580 [archaeon]
MDQEKKKNADAKVAKDEAKTAAQEAKTKKGIAAHTATESPKRKSNRGLALGLLLAVIIILFVIYTTL